MRSRDRRCSATAITITYGPTPTLALTRGSLARSARENTIVQPHSARADKFVPRPEPGSFVPGELLVSYERHDNSE